MKDKYLRDSSWLALGLQAALGGGSLLAISNLSTTKSRREARNCAGCCNCVRRAGQLPDLGVARVGTEAWIELAQPMAGPGPPEAVPKAKARTPSHFVCGCAGRKSRGSHRNGGSRFAERRTRGTRRDLACPSRRTNRRLERARGKQKPGCSRPRMEPIGPLPPVSPPFIRERHCAFADS